MARGESLPSSVVLRNIVTHFKGSLAVIVSWARGLNKTYGYMWSLLVLVGIILFLFFSVSGWQSWDLGRKKDWGKTGLIHFRKHRLSFLCRCLLPLFSSVHQFGEWAFQLGRVRDDCASVQGVPSRPMASTVAATSCEGLWRLHWTYHPQLLDPRHLLYKKDIFLMILCNILTYLVYNWWKQSIYFWITPKLYNSRIYKKK